MEDAQRQLRGVDAKALLAAAILAAQAVGIGFGRVTGESFWSWVPHDCVLVYRIEVALADRELSPAEVGRRYGVQPEGRRADYPPDLTAIIRRHEQRRPHDEARVVVHYAVNGGESEVWHWPPR